LDYFHSSLYSCAGVKSKNADCKKDNGVNYIKTIGPFRKVSDAFWEVSFVPYPNWNGKLKMEFVVWDEFLSSDPETCLVKVWPINDPPTVVKHATTIVGEYYTKTGRGKYESVKADADKTKFNIYDDKSDNERTLEAVPLLESSKGSDNKNAPTRDKDRKDKVYRVDRVRTAVQDIDFFFEYYLTLNATLIHAIWIPSLMPKDHPCWFTGPLIVNCEEEITRLNAFLTVGGFPVLLDEDTKTALGIFILNDTGNVDKWDRPLASGFTIEFFKPDEDDDLKTPIAAIVILPVIAAITAASIACAWILLGQRAQDYAGAGFEAMMVSSGGGGNASPLYDAQGLECTNALYGEGHGGGHGSGGH